MRFRLYDIVPRLQPYVKVICSMDTADLAQPRSFRVLPDTCVELFINYTETVPTTISGKKITGSARSFIVSRMSNFMDVQSAGKTGCIAVCLYPGTAYRFFSLPMNEVSDSLTGLPDLWKAAANMEEKVMIAKTNDERVAIIQQYLVQQLINNNDDDKAIEYCLWQMNILKGQISVAALSDKAGLSARQLNRRFNDRIGLSPKEFARITRFIHSLAHLKKYPAMSLTEIAYESGYYDQAHFIHDYREFSGFAPGQLINSKDVIY